MKLRTTRPTAKIRRKKPPVKLNATAARRRSRVEEFEDEEEDYYETSEPNMKLSHAFIVVLILHLIAVAGVFGFNSMKNRQNALAKITAESSAAQTAAVSGAESANTGTAAAAAAEENPASHTVAAGDTLTRIAAKHNTSIEALEQANGLTAESILRVGQVLQIPAAGATVAATTVAPATASSAPPAPANRTSTASAPPAPAPAPTTANTAAPASAPAPTAATNTPATTATAATTTTVGEDGIYVVVSGDNPYSIARRLGVSYQDLLEANNIDDPTKLQIGQKLKVPGR
jgi:LysM repeat protein